MIAALLITAIIIKQFSQLTFELRCLREMRTEGGGAGFSSILLFRLNLWSHAFLADCFNEDNKSLNSFTAQLDATLRKMFPNELKLCVQLLHGELLREMSSVYANSIAIV